MKRMMKGGLLAAATGVMLMVSGMASAQAPGGGPGAGPPRGGMGMGMGMGTPDRAGTIQRQGLNDPALKLTDAQKAEIDKIADAYVKEITAVNEKYPMTPGSPPSQEAMSARQKANENLTAAVGKVLNADQRKTWEAAQASRRGGPGGPGGGRGGPGGPGGFGGPGGPGGPGPGGPGAGRPPGQ